MKFYMIMRIDKTDVDKNIYFLELRKFIDACLFYDIPLEISIRFEPILEKEKENK